MRLLSTKMRGWRDFPDTELNLAEIAGRLIALTGPNGAGKSSLLEMAMPGCIYRKLPTRGDLASHAVARDAFVESKVNNGHAYTIRQTVDAHTGKGESLLLDEDGTPILKNAKIKEFRQWARDHFTAPEVLYTGVFIPQQWEGLGELPRGERMAVLLRALGIERWERMAKLASDYAKAAQEVVDQLRARLSDEKERTPDLEQAKAALAEAEKIAQAASDVVATARAAYVRAQNASEDAQRAREIAEQRRQVTKRLEAARSQEADLVTRIQNNRGLLDRMDEIAAAVSQDAKLQGEIDKSRDARRTIEKNLECLRGEKKAHNTALANATHRRDEAQIRLGNANTRLADRDVVEKAARDLPTLREAATKSEALLTEASAAIARLQAQQLTHKDDRIDGLRGTLSDIADTGAGKEVEDFRDHARTGLASDDERVKEAEELPTTLLKAKDAEDEAAGLLLEARREVNVAEQLAARRDEMGAALADKTEAEGIVAEAEAERERELEREKEIDAETGVAEIALAKHDEQVSVWTSERNELAATVKLATPLAQAKARIEAYEPQLEHARQTITQAGAELDGLPDVEAEDVDLADYEQRVKRSEGLEREAWEAVARQRKTIEDAEAGAERIAGLTSQLFDAGEDLADWVRLHQDLGRDGLQGVEIGNAGPELNTQANDFLHNCFGPRFTVEIQTSRLDATGKRLIEDLPIMVIDAEKGTVHEIATYSGGERALLNEALSLTVAAISCKSNGIERPTLFRDETAAALDKEYGPAYIAMLRRAADLIDIDKLVFVTHDERLIGMADTVLTLKDGQIIQ